MTEPELFSKSLKDFFTPQMIKIAIIPLIVTFVIMYVLFMGVANYSLDSLDMVITETQQGHEYQIPEDAPFYFAWSAIVLKFLLHYSITAWLAGFLLYTVGTYFIMIFSVFITLIVIGFFTPMIISILNKRNYPQIKLNGHGSLFSPIYIALKTLLMMILLFIVLIPLYFIPLVNIFAFNLPIYYFFHKLLNFDVASTMLSVEEYKVIHKEKKWRVRFRTLLLYFISMVPFITLFSTVFYVIYLANGYFEELKFVNKESKSLNILDKF